jgi:O-succinylbenzoate synthase
MTTAPSSVVALELRRVRLPLVAPFVTAHGVTRERDVLLVRAIRDDGVEGWGECAAPTEPTYTSEYVDGAHALLRAYAWSLETVKGHPMAKAAVEAAVLDADLRARGISLREHLGGTRDRVVAGVAIGAARDVGALLDEVHRRVDEGYRRIKLKVMPGWDVEPVRAVRNEFGDGLLLQVDGNGAYAGEDTSALRLLDDFGLLLIEQPLGDDDLDGHVALATRLRTPICLDETITSAHVAAHALDSGACRVVNVKPGRVGGLAAAKEIHDVCVERGAGAWVGGMLETGVGRATILALASLPGFTLPGDVSASNRWYTTDLTEPFVLDPSDGTIAVPTAPVAPVDPTSAGFVVEHSSTAYEVPFAGSAVVPAAHPLPSR